GAEYVVAENLPVVPQGREIPGVGREVQVVSLEAVPQRQDEGELSDHEHEHERWDERDPADPWPGTVLPGALGARLTDRGRRFDHVNQRAVLPAGPHVPGSRNGLAPRRRPGRWGHWPGRRHGGG